jgi:[ribosomal protein S18]-alanine N-acetyltransferase
VRESNTPARTLYRKHGFSDVGIRKDYYEKPSENAILMTLFLK